MSADLRYELKFILDDRRLVQARNWIATETRTSTRYAPRTVNSLYYDSPNLRSVTDNIYGMPDRTKYRLRWYDDGDRQQPQSACFEAKQRRGRLNRKQRTELPTIEHALAEKTHHEIHQHLIEQLGQTPGLERLSCYLPTLQIRYTREYFEDPQGLRITLDSNIAFHLTPLNARLYFGRENRHPWSVMEIKFSAQMKPTVSRTLHRLRISPKRHSKYIAGLAAFGQVMYF